MPKGYRKIKFFTQEQAERIERQRNDENRRVNMVGSHYVAEEESPGNWIVQHYVVGQRGNAECANGYLPYDYDDHYLEGYIWNG